MDSEPANGNTGERYRMRFLGMVLNLWLARPIRCSIGLTVILLGIPFYQHWSKRAAEPSPMQPRTVD